MKKIIILSILFLFNAFIAFPQFSFKTIDMSNGLAENTVRSISQDEHGFIWIATQNGLCCYDGMQFYTFRHDINNPTSIKENNINSILTEKEGVWVGTIEDLEYYKFSDNTFTTYSIIAKDGKISPFKSNIKTIMSVDGKIYVLDRGGQLYKQNSKTTFRQINARGLYIYSMCSYNKGQILLHTPKGIYSFNCKTGRIKEEIREISEKAGETIYYSKNLNTIYIGYEMGAPSSTYKIVNKQIKRSNVYAPTSLYSVIDYNGGIVFGTNGYGIIFQSKNGRISQYTYSNSNICADAIMTLFVDSDQNLWIGSYRYGISLHSEQTNIFHSLTATKGQLTDRIVTAIASDSRHVYLGLDGGGLNIIDKHSGKIESLNTSNSNILGDNALSIIDDGEYIWTCIYNKGLCRYSKKDKTFKNYPINSSNQIWSITDDSEGNIWLSGLQMYIFNKQSEKYSTFNTIGKWSSNVLFHKNSIWISTTEDGLYCLDRKTRKIKAHYTENSKTHNIPSNHIGYIYIDSKGQIWFSPYNMGLYRLDTNTGKYVHFDKSSGFYASNANAIVETPSGDLWIGSDNGIYHYNRKSRSFVRFDKEDNMASTMINHDACFIYNDTISFGTTNGLIYFNSRNFKYKTKPYQTSITGITILSNGKYINTSNLNDKDVIELAYDQNFITINFSVPEYISPGKLRFACKMEGFDNAWRNIGEDRHATYTNMPHGEYTFRIRILGADGQWKESSSVMHITIAPPWWLSPWAICLWCILLIAILIAAYKVYRYQALMKIRARKEEMEMDMLKRDHEMKLRFYTNISHEFRTPLTLIITPLEVLLKEEKDKVLSQKLGQIYRNAKNLLTLVNQLLDFRKLEMHGEKLNLCYGDISEFVENTVQAFIPNALNSSKELTVDIRANHLYTSFDRDKICKILNNLLSNALKFTKEGDSITASLEKTVFKEQDCILIKVSDTGIGIPKEKIKNIFDRFYQVNDNSSCNTGSGIGLHIVKEYVSLHKGHIEVVSENGKGTTFSIYIPIIKADSPYMPVKENAVENKHETAEIPVSEAPETGMKKILVVEDNQEFRSFMTEQLSKDFNVIQASDGEEGEASAIQNLPDIIITDIMMPKVDGVEMCKRLKNNIQTSHIPVIILTARTSDEFMLSGYEAGADAYLSKPFKFDILLAKIRNLIKRQEERRAKFSHTIEISTGDLATTPIDEKLLKDTIKAIEANISNTEYSIDDLCTEIGLGRTNLYKKLQSITGMTPANFIRSIRLKKAAVMLKSTDMNISEIADHVGFGNIKYFNKHFKDEFGMTPTQFKKESDDN